MHHKVTSTTSLYTYSDFPGCSINISDTLSQAKWQHVATSCAWALQVTLLDNPLLSFTAALSPRWTQRSERSQFWTNISLASAKSFSASGPTRLSWISDGKKQGSIDVKNLKKLSCSKDLLNLLSTVFTSLKCDTCEILKHPGISKQYQVITADLEDVGIVTVGVLATKLIDLAPSGSHSNGMFRTINGAVSVCLEEWSPVNVVHDFLNGMILHIIAGAESANG